MNAVLLSSGMRTVAGPSRLNGGKEETCGPERRAQPTGHHPSPPRAGLGASPARAVPGRLPSLTACGAWLRGAGPRRPRCAGPRQADGDMDGHRSRRKTGGGPQRSGQGEQLPLGSCTGRRRLRAARAAAAGRQQRGAGGTTGAKSTQWGGADAPRGSKALPALPLLSFLPSPGSPTLRSPVFGLPQQ